MHGTSIPSDEDRQPLQYCGEHDQVWARIRGREYHLEVQRAADKGIFTDGAVRVDVRHSGRLPVATAVAAGTADGHCLDMSAYLNMAAALDGVLDTQRANPVNAPWL